MKALPQFLLGFFLLVAAHLAVAQEEITPVVEGDVVTVSDTGAMPHSPLKATLYSAALPGLGQAYNKKYWKIPIVYAALGTTVYFIIDNTQQFRRFRTAYIAEIDDDPSTVSEFADRNVSSEAIKSTMETYQGYLELSYIFAGVVYALNIVDANVDAHLFDFDVSDELSLRLQPDLIRGQAFRNPAVGLRMRIRFKGN